VGFHPGIKQKLRHIRAILAVGYAAVLFFATFPRTFRTTINECLEIYPTGFSRNGVNYKVSSDSSSSGRLRAPIHPITLSFPTRALQDAFREEHTRRSVKFVRLSLTLAALLYLLFGFLDQYLAQEAADKILIIRIVVSTLLLGVVALTYTWTIKTHFQLTMVSVVLFGSAGIILMITVTESVGGYNFYAGLMLSCMYAHSLLRLRFIYATVATWIVIIFYEFVVIWLRITPIDILMNNTFFLVATNLIGMFSSYGLEYYMRTAFWQTRRIREEQDKLESEYQRKSKELDAARKIQLSMLPNVVPAHPTVDVCVAMKTAVEIGGDYYDFYVEEDHTFTFAIGDATGHGAQAGAMVTATKILFSNLAHSNDILDILRRASQYIKRMRVPKLYMALAIGRLRGYHLELVGAGLPPALLYRCGTGKIESIPLKGVPLGSFPDFPYRKKRLELKEGDTILFITDGFPELFNGEAEMIGYERVKSLFAEVATESPSAIVAHFTKFMKGWLNGSAPQDDTTFMVFKMKQPNATCVIEEEAGN
jgi:hypothetical protein